MMGLAFNWMCFAVEQCGSSSQRPLKTAWANICLSAFCELVWQSLLPLRFKLDIGYHIR